MTEEQWKKIIVLLLSFVERASKEEATPEEIAALPKVADVLVSMRPATFL